MQGRLALWATGWQMLGDFPITGIGIGQFSPVMHLLYSSSVFRFGQFVPHAHNLVLEYALELGVFGGVAFGALVWVSVRHALRAQRR